MFFNCEICTGRTKKPKKKMAYKHIDNYYPKEWYQPITLYLSDYLVTDKRYILTMVDHFSKCGWIIVMFDKNAVTVLRAIKLCFITNGKLESFHTDNGSEFVNETLKTYQEKSGIHHIWGSPYHPQNQGAVEAFNRTVQNFLYLAKDMNRDNFELEDSIIDFLLHYNNRIHSITKFYPYEIMVKRSEKLIMDKVRENILNSRKTNKIEEFKQGLVVFVSSKVVKLNKEMKYLNYYKSTISKKEEQKEYFIVKAKIIDEKRNYCKVEIISKHDKNFILQLKEIWKISKEALK